MTDTATAPAAQKKVTVKEALNQALADAMAENEKVLLLGEDVADPEGGGVMAVTRGLSTRFGDHRVRSTPIAEQAIIGAAIGASLVGWRPIAEIMIMNFSTVCMDMIVNHAAKLRFMSGGQTSVPIVVRMAAGAGIASGGQHSDHLEAWFAHTAGLKVVIPSTPEDAYGLMLSSIDDPDPVIFIENILNYGTTGLLPPTGTRVPLSKAKVTREGTDVTIVSYSRMATVALAAAEIAAQQGVSVEVVDLRTISPWDQETVFRSGAKTGRVLVVHEAVKAFGPGGEIAAETSRALFGQLKKPVERLASAYSPVPFSKPLETAYMPDAERVAEAAIQLAR